MSDLIAALRLLFSFLPAPVQVFILGVFAIILIVVVFKVVALVLNSIPFL